MWSVTGAAPVLTRSRPLGPHRSALPPLIQESCSHEVASSYRSLLLLVLLKMDGSI